MPVNISTRFNSAVALGIRSPNVMMSPRYTDPNAGTPIQAAPPAALQSRAVSTLEGNRLLVNNSVYLIEKTIGKGASKTAYLASRELDLSSPEKGLISTANKVALLVSRITGTEQEKKSKLSDLRKEVEVLNNCKDLDGVVQLIKGISYFEGSKSDVAIVTEFCDEGTLDRWAKGKPLHERLQMLIDLAKVVQKLHAKGLAHRDIKPANICVKSDNGRFIPKIIDLGSMCLKSESQMNYVPGTPSYMPKLISDLKFVEHDPLKHDVYSLGLTICEILADEVETDTFLKSLNKDLQKEVSQNPIGFFNGIRSEDFQRFINSLDGFYDSIRPLLQSIVQEDLSKVPSIDYVVEALENFSKTLETSPDRVRRSFSPELPAIPVVSSTRKFEVGINSKNLLNLQEAIQTPNNTTPDDSACIMPPEVLHTGVCRENPQARAADSQGFVKCEIGSSDPLKTASDFDFR